MVYQPEYSTNKCPEKPPNPNQYFHYSHIMFKIIRAALVFLLLLSFSKTHAQQNKKLSYTQKGLFYFYWGYNWSAYTDSDIHFEGNDHNFTLYNVQAKDRPSKFKFDTYFNPLNFSAPQFNARFGYFIKDNWEISVGMDHMKYVAQQYQTVNINGYFERDGDTNTFSDADQIDLTYSFLQYEHTDGLNYINVGLRRFFNIINKDKIDLNLIAGAETGIILPRSDVTLLKKERSDRYHLSGYGINLTGAVNITFFDKYFLQTELKGGYVNMPKVLTSYEGDTASQNFFFAQSNVLFGGYFPLFTRK